MFKYSVNHQQMGGDGMKVNRLHKSMGKKKGNFFGSPPLSFIIGRSRLDGAATTAMDDLFFEADGCHQQIPRSRSCQCTARIGNGRTKNEIEGGKMRIGTMAQQQEEMVDHRKWWMEESSSLDIPTIDGQGKSGKREKWRSRKEEIRNGGTKSSSNLMHHTFLLPMLLNNVGGGGCSPSTNYCCSDSPCSSSSFLPDQIPILSQYQNGNQNGYIPPAQEKLSPAEQWPSNEELANCLGRLFPSIDEWNANPQDVLASLLCLRPFIYPPQILQKLLQHTIFVQHANAANFSKEGQRRLFDNVLSFCALWIRSIPYDFRDQPMRDRLLAVLSLSGTQKDIMAQRICDDLLAELRMALSRLERYEGAIRSLEPQLEINWEKRWEGPTGLMAMGRTPLQIAQQLTHIELERLSMVGLDELVQTVGQANSLDQLGQLFPPGCVGHYVQWFNQLSQLVASEVLRHQHKRHRAKCMDFLVKMASECLALGNFNSLAAIVAGLSAQPVARLKKTWAKVEKGRFEVLQRQLDPSGNFATYRATLKAAMIWAASAGGSERMPLSIETQTQYCSPLLVIPFFGLLLKDLFHLYCQCRLPGPGGHLNRIAFDEFGELMAQVDGWKGTECKFTRISPILQHLLLAPLLPERSMFLLSYGYEAPENNADREQLRQFNQTNLHEKMKAGNGPQR